MQAHYHAMSTGDAEGVLSSSDEFAAGDDSAAWIHFVSVCSMSCSELQ